MRLVSIDFETHLVQNGLLCPPIVCSAMAIPGLETTLHKWPTGLAPLVAEMRNPANTFVGANIAYDFGCLLGYKPELIDLVWGIYSEGRVFDVQIAAMLNAIYDGRSHDGELYRRDGSRIQSGRYSLHECVKEWLQRDDAKHNDRWRLSYALLENVPMADWPKDAIQYPIDDAENTLQVAQAQLAGAKNLHDMKVQAHAAFCMHLGAIWGIRTSAPRVQALTLNVNTKLEELRSFAKEQGFMRPDGTKNKKAIMSRVTQAYDAVPPTTEKGSVSTERQVLENSGDEVLVKFSEISKWEKVATYLPVMEEASRAPMNVRSNPLLATGRASYEGLIQLLPRKGGVRECFAARPGTAFVSVDYAAIEMATLAQVCLWTVKYSKLAEALNKGLDPHSMLAAKLCGVNYEHFMANMNKDLRQASKACLAADTLVLTDRGWIAIVDVVVSDKVWDGETWVTHQGVVYQGEQWTESSRMVEATPDHEVLTAHGWVEWAKAHTNHSLFQSALDLVHLPSSNGIEEYTKENPPGFIHGLDVLVEKSSGLREISSAREGILDAGLAPNPASSPKSMPNTHWLCRTRGAELDYSIGSKPPRVGATTHEIKISTTMELGASVSRPSGWPIGLNSSSMSVNYMASMTPNCRWTELITTGGMSLGIFNSARPPQTSIIEKRSVVSGSALKSLKKKSPVYDLVNAGPNHRFTILTSEGPIIVSNCNFGFPGLMSEATFVTAKKREGASVCEWLHKDGKCGEAKSFFRDDLECVRCVDEAKKLRKGFLSTWTEIRPYWNWVVARKDSLEHFVSKRVRGGLRPSQAANSLFQGLAADGAKRAVIALTEEMYTKPDSPLYNSRLVMFTHDETIIEAPLECLHEAAKRQTEIMLAEMKKVVPDVRVSAAPAAMLYLSKDAESVYDKAGRLVPWDKEKQSPSDFTTKS